MSWEPPFSTGTESAEPAGLRRLLGLSGRNNLLLAGGAVVAAGILFLPGATRERVIKPTAVTSTPIGSPSPSAYPTGGRPEALLGTPVPATSSAPTALPNDDATGNRALYTIYLYKLPGLAPDVAPGTTLDIWVTWDRAVTGKPSVDLLVEDAVLQRIETGFDEGPVADLALTRKDVVNVIYGERFGQFNVTIDAP